MAIGGVTGSAIGSGDTNRRTTSPDFIVGTTTVLNDGYAWVYVKAMGSIVANQSDVAVDGDFIASDGGGTYLNTGSFEDGEYGWVRSPEKVA